MTLSRISATAAAIAVVSSLVAPGPTTAQSPDLVYISNVSVSQAGGVALETIQDQTRATLDRLGEALRSEGLDYGDVVVSNVFLKDARHFGGMNDVYRQVFTSDAPTRATLQADLLDPRALIQISVVAARGAKEVITPPRMTGPTPPYSRGIRAGNTLFIAGTTSRDPDTYEPVTGDAGIQTTQVFSNIELVLDEAGMSMDDLVTCKVFLDDQRGYGAMNQAYGAAVSADTPPARATVRAALMNSVFSSEVQCVAVDADFIVRIAEGRQRSSLPFSPGIDTGDRVYLSGMVGRGADVTEKSLSILETIRATLAAADLDFSDVEEVWVYLTDIRNWEDAEAALAEVMPDGGPTPTVVGTVLVGDFDVEIQMVAKR